MIVESKVYVFTGELCSRCPQVYDVTKFLSEHPAGPDLLLDFAGADATGS